MQDNQGERMKVFSYAKNPTLDYVNEERLEGFDASLHWKHLGDGDNRVYFSFDPEFVKLQEQAEEFDVKVYDANTDELQAIKPKLAYLQQELQDIKSKMFRELDIFDILTAIVSKDKYVIEKLEQLKKEHDDFLKSLGF
jgi:hypothetical protein